MHVVITSYRCDKCRREISEDRAMLAMKTGSQRDYSDLDLCPACATALRSWLSTAPAPAATTTNGEPTPTHTR